MCIINRTLQLVNFCELRKHEAELKRGSSFFVMKQSAPRFVKLLCMQPSTRHNSVRTWNYEFKSPFDWQDLGSGYNRHPEFLLVKPLGCVIVGALGLSACHTEQIKLLEWYRLNTEISHGAEVKGD